MCSSVRGITGGSLPGRWEAEGQFHMRGSAPGSERRWVGSTQYPCFINHLAKAYRQTPSPPSPRQPLGLHRASKMSTQIWVLMQIIISIIFLHLCPQCRGNKAFPLSGSIRLQLVGILDSEPDGLAMLAAYVQQAVLCQARIRFLLIWGSQECIRIYLPDSNRPCHRLLKEKLTELCRCVQQEILLLLLSFCFFLIADTVQLQHYVQVELRVRYCIVIKHLISFFNEKGFSTIKGN